MKLRVDQLNEHLSGQLKPVYFLSGEEPLQMMEAVDSIVSAAKQQGYIERDIMVVDPQFSWDRLTASTYELSLFSSKQLIDLRLSGAKPGKSGSQAIREYLDRLPDDKILLIRAGKLDASTRRSAWVKDLEKQGVMIQVWDLSPAQTLGWVSKRIRQAGFQPSNEAVRLLTERVEGNLLAANQEIQKMSLLFRDKENTQQSIPIDEQQILQVVSDSSRFSVFDLSDAILAGDHRRIKHILEVLKQEGTAIQLVLWSMSSVSRQLYEAQVKMSQGVAMHEAIRNLPKMRQNLFKSALQRLQTGDWNRILQYNAELDRLSKGVGDVIYRYEQRLWDKSFDFALLLSGYRKKR